MVRVVNCVLCSRGEEQHLLNPRRLVVNLLPALADTLDAEYLANWKAEEDVLHKVDVGEHLRNCRLGADSQFAVFIGRLRPSREVDWSI